MTLKEAYKIIGESKQDDDREINENTYLSVRPAKGASYGGLQTSAQ